MIVENFFKQPKQGDIVKVYLDYGGAYYGTVDHLDYVFYEEKRKGVEETIKRQVVALNVTTPVELEECDFCLPESKVIT